MLQIKLASSRITFAIENLIAAIVVNIILINGNQLLISPSPGRKG
jgi:hypothetical protein